MAAVALLVLLAGCNDGRSAQGPATPGVLASPVATLTPGAVATPVVTSTTPLLPTASPLAAPTATPLPLSEPAKRSGTVSAQAAAEALGDERQMDEFDVMAAEADGVTTPAYRGKIQAIANEELAKAAVSITLEAATRTTLLSRQSALRAKLAARLLPLGDAREVVAKALRAASLTSQANGAKTRGIEVTLPTQVVADLLMIRTVSPEGVLVYGFNRATRNIATGRPHAIQRTRTVKLDGSVVIKFHRDRVASDGAKLTADWSKTLQNDGTASGSGVITITPKDGTARSLIVSLKGTFDAPTLALTDAATKVATEVRLPYDGAAEATVKQPEGGGAEVVTVDAEPDAKSDSRY